MGKIQEPEPLEKKVGAGAGAAKKLALYDWIINSMTGYSLISVLSQLLTPYIVLYPVQTLPYNQRLKHANWIISPMTGNNLYDCIVSPMTRYSLTTVNYLLPISSFTVNPSL